MNLVNNLDRENLDNKLNDEEDKDKDKTPKVITPKEENKEYKIDFYKGNISNLVNLINEIIPLQKIPDFIKRTFSLNEFIYSEEYYFKGIFPKIIVSFIEGEPNKIKGICSYFYEYNEDLSENLVIRINGIFAIDDYENQIIKMINYIKENSIYNSLEIYLLYDKIDNKFIPNKEAKEIFEKKLNFKWRCVVRDEKQQLRYIKLYYIKDNTENENISNINNFVIDNLSIITVNNEENTYTLKNKIDVKSENNMLNKKSYNKYINPYPIYSLLYENSRFLNEFLNESKNNEIKERKNKLWRFVILENGWNFLEDEKKKIKKIDIDIRQSIFKEIEKYFMTKELKCFCDLYKTNLSKNFESNYSILYNDIYYNRISSDKIKILKENQTNSKFFLVPSNDNTALFYISEVNKKLRDLLIDSNKNVYEKFLDFQPSTQKEIFTFSLSSYRDITYIPHIYQNELKTIYIPSFSIKSHLFSYNFKDVEKNVKIIDIDSNSPSYVNSVDEFINIEFKPDNNIENCFSVVPVEGGNSDFILNDSFIIGIFDNDIINNEKLPLLQFLYITKEHFLTKNNYTPGKKSQE